MFFGLGDGRLIVVARAVQQVACRPVDLGQRFHEVLAFGLGEVCGELFLRVLVRDPARSAGLPDRAKRVTGDLGQPAMLAPAFDGADGLFLLVPGIGADHTAHAIAAAQAAGVRRIVHLSSYAVIGDPMPAMGHWHHEREQMVRACGIPATILRPSGFMTNALDWLPTIREGDFVLDPLGPGRAAPIDPADIAAVAALVLTEDGHQGAEYALTGDEVLTVTEQVRILAAAIGRDLEVRRSPPRLRPSGSATPTGHPRQLPTPSSKDSRSCAPTPPDSAPTP
jgi:uncharacterized protein YbjT (DUF2867 family)